MTCIEIRVLTAPRFASVIEDVDTMKVVVLRGSKWTFNIPGNPSEAYGRSRKSRDL
jgi:hypothetical protein